MGFSSQWTPIYEGMFFSDGKPIPINRFLQMEYVQLVKALSM